MNLLEYVAALFGVTAAFAYANHHLLGLPRNPGLLILGLAATLVLRLLAQVFPDLQLANTLTENVMNADFGGLLLHVFLAFLLFAAAFNTDARALVARKWTILALATAGVVISTVAMAAGMYGAFALVGLDVPIAWCLVFGALISPTDPVSVTGVLKRLGLPERLQAIIAGESLFNDGIGIVLFTIFLELAAGGQGEGVTVGQAALDFLREAGGGAVLGLLAGGLAFAAMRGIDEYNIELMISLALATGTFGLAQHLHVSGPVAVVVAGLIIGSVGVRYAVSGTTHEYLEKFWSLTDELLNAVLFLLIGVEFAVIQLEWAYLGAALLAVLLSLAVRGFSIAAASLPLNMRRPNKLRAIGLLTWSGLRGGISVALVLSLPPGEYREPLLTACYGVVIFTMLVQGLSLEAVARRLYPRATRDDDEEATRR